MADTQCLLLAVKTADGAPVNPSRIADAICPARWALITIAHPAGIDELSVRRIPPEAIERAKKLARESMDW